MSELSMAESVCERLKEQILRVERAPGDLLYETDLATEFKVSKTPVREALHLLSHSGWVVVLPRKGYMVRPVELRDVRDIFGIRRLLEPPLAGQAATHAAPGHISLLEDLVALQRAAATDLDGALEAARHFHLALADISGSRRVHAILANLVDEVRRLHYLLPQIGGHITSAEELRAHEGILAAVKAKDATRACDLTLEHLNEVAQTLVNGFAGV